MEDLTFADIIAVFKRRRKYFFASMLLVTMLAAVFAMRWSHYRASATIEIEQPKIASGVTDMGGKAGIDDAPGLADRRINQIAQKVTSVESLSKIISKLDLYPGANKTMPAAKLTSIMRRGVKLAFVSSEVANPVAAQKESAEQLSALAFTLSFDYSNPEKTKEALDELVNRFIEEETALRLSQSKATSSFLNDQIKQLENSIAEQEKKLADFRAKYGDSGAAALMFNQQASMSSAMSLQSVESQINTTQASIATLRGQIATTDTHMPTVEDGKTINSPRMQLTALQSQLASLSGRYGPEHPDVMKVKSQISALKKQGIADTLTTAPDNPTYMQVSAQLSAAQAQYEGLVKQRDALKAQQEKYDRMIAENPEVEKQASQISLDLENAKDRYRALKEKKLAADMRLKLDSNTEEQRLKVIVPSMVPETTSPKRMLIFIAGLFLAVMCGIGTVILVEALSQSVRGANHLASILGAAPLVSIPRMQLKN